MMKTITDMQPLIWGMVLDDAQRRTRQKKAWLRAVAWGLPLLYVAGGMWIVAETGLAPWDVRFWIIFLPFFLFTERVFWAVAGRMNQQPSA